MEDQERAPGSGAGAGAQAGNTTVPEDEQAGPAQEKVGPPFYGVDWDDALEQDGRVTAELTRGHLRAERWLIQHAGDTVLRLKVVTDFHRVMFEGAFPEFAGKLRGPSPQYVHRNVSFGSYRGVHADQVPEECAQLVARLERYVLELDRLRASPGDVDLREEVLKVAAYAHCELIRIHPFVNGNGRVARTTINYFAWRYGYLPVAYGRPTRGEYLEAIRAWLQHKKIEPFVDFLRPLFTRRTPGGW